MSALVVSNGLCLSPSIVEEFVATGVACVSISLDGDKVVHNSLRPLNRPLAGSLELSDPTAGTDSFSQVMAAFRNLAAARLPTAVITQVSRDNIGELDAVEQILLSQDISSWQIQLTSPMGRSARCNRKAEIESIAPSELRVVYDFIRRVQKAGTIRCLAADNIGYFGRDEPFLRASRGDPNRFWTGCQAGMRVLGITSNGGVRGCLSMPDSLLEGSIREMPLRDIWQRNGAFAYNRAYAPGSLTGQCASCEFGNLCRAGCHSFTTTALGRLTENPHCIRLVGSRP
jgi:radical SAM protein with 4Fe4S-binding SPASM domain